MVIDGMTQPASIRTIFFEVGSEGGSRCEF
jgi:hypothetical protein